MVVDAILDGMCSWWVDIPCWVLVLRVYVYEGVHVAFGAGTVVSLVVDLSLL